MMSQASQRYNKPIKIRRKRVSQRMEQSLQIKINDPNWSRRGRLCQTCQIHKLAQNDLPVFLAIVRANEFPNKREDKRRKRSLNREAKFAAAHGVTEGQKRQINKQTDPKNIFYLLKKENSRFSTASLLIAGKIGNYS